MTKGQQGKSMQVSLIHMQISDSLKNNLETAEKTLYRAADTGSKLICLPEYFAMPSNLEDYDNLGQIVNDTRELSIQLLRNASKKIDAYIVGGTIFEKFRGKYYNTCLFLRKGKILGKFRKMHLTEWEKNVGLNIGMT
jgi:predicted amidohydrolase